MNPLPQLPLVQSALNETEGAAGEALCPVDDLAQVVAGMLHQVIDAVHLVFRIRLLRVDPEPV